MIALSSFMEEARSRVATVEGKGQPFGIKAASVFFGFAFIWAGVGLWLVPGLEMTSYVMLAKMGLSILLVTAGVGMTQIATDKPRKELHFDARNRQLLVLESLPRQRMQVVQTINYEEIFRVDVSDTLLEVSGENGGVLVALDLDGEHARLDAVAQLRSQAIFPC
ncbi:hypothetical protein shim_11190 [Shimia sp. SK013]|uniref:hypothetical protein n=1 Tax=Shimia sp. SK013 TaxID=1389006 RepID=UPI0006B4C093|nr:hypothetical protein [Shimia sp. SK013]KPA22831.1 hypothetical protein shim_11190 [Shimia sp. SK013]